MDKLDSQGEAAQPERHWVAELERRRLVETRLERSAERWQAGGACVRHGMSQWVAAVVRVAMSWCRPISLLKRG